MSYFKKFSRHDVTEKYGFNNHGVFADEPIMKGDIIWKCDVNTCDYLRSKKLKLGARREEVAAMMEKDPCLKDFIQRYIDMRDDDVYDIPSYEIKNSKSEYICECAFFNHSCEPNVGFSMGSSNVLQALCNIKVNEELTIDYQFIYTEATFLKVVNCKCGTQACRGSLLFDQYRNEDWQRKYYKYSCKFFIFFYQNFYNSNH